MNGTPWQRSFWDHALRVNEEVDAVIDYILDNPVKAGLVDERSAYPFSGVNLVEQNERNEAGTSPAPLPGPSRAR